MYNFLEVRKKFYKDVFYKFRTNKLGKHYSKYKALFCTELASIFAYLFIKNKISPNSITFLFIFLIILGTILMASGNNQLILIGVIIFFFKNSLDLTDGFVARTLNKTSAIGDKLDTWAGFLSVIIFQVAFGLYIFSKTQNILFLYLTIIMLLFNSVDFKIHYLSLATDKEKRNIYSYRSQVIKQRKKNLKNFSLLNYFEIVDYDGRSRYTDLILLLIIIEIYFNQVLISKAVVMVWLITGFFKFFYKLKKTIDLDKKNS